MTGADDSSIMCWDFETGNKNLVFTNAHGDEEITSMAFDGNWRRLITGARNGTVKVCNDRQVNKGAMVKFYHA